MQTPGGKASSSFFPGEDLQSEEGLVEKLVERWGASSPLFPLFFWVLKYFRVCFPKDLQKS